MEGRVSRGKDRGYALLSVLIVISLLSILSLTLANHLRTKTFVLSREQQRLEGRALAEAGQVLALLELTKPDRGQGRFFSGVPQVIEFEGHSILVSVQDELGRVDLNRSDGAQLERYFAGFTSNAREAAALRDAVLDWRDEDPVARPLGAEAAWYRRSGARVLPSNQPFQTVSELLWVKGMTRALYDCMAPGLTVYAQRAEVYAPVAHPLVREVLSLEEDAGAGWAVSAMRGGLGGRAFEISVVVNPETEVSYHQSIVLRFTENVADPYWVLDLRQPEAWKSGACLTMEVNRSHEER